MTFQNLLCTQGHEMQDGDQFCATCGSERAGTDCPECGSEIREGAVFCVKCGRRLVTERASVDARQGAATPRSNHDAIWHAVDHLAPKAGPLTLPAAIIVAYALVRAARERKRSEQRASFSSVSSR